MVSFSTTSFWRETLVLVFLGLASALAWLVGPRWLALWLTLPVLVRLLWLVRQSDVRFFGPHFYFDVVRLARRGQSTRLRVAYLLALFGVLIYMYSTMIPAVVMRPNDLAHITERFAYVLFLVQNIAVLVLAPAYFASAIAEERERRTLELLFTTQLSNTEIVLGILVARIIHLVGFVLAGFPILCALQFWGGIDMLLLAGNLFNTLLNILTLGSVCLMASAMAQTASGALLASYLIVLPLGIGLMGCTSGGLFVLQDERSGSVSFYTLQQLPWIAVGHLVMTTMFLGLAIGILRDTGFIEPAIVSLPRPTVIVQTVLPPLPLQDAREPERFTALGGIYTLPPVSDHGLLWKERFLGGPSNLFAPIMLLLAWPICFLFVMLGITLWAEIRSGRYNFEQRLELWLGFLRFLYYIFLGAYVLGVAFRAASSIARERQQQTLEPLLLLPVERREVLFAKWVGSLWRGWPWLVLIFGDVMLGVCIGAYHPFSAVLQCLAPWPMILFFASLGLLLSVTVKTVLRANLVMVLVLIVFLCSTAVGFAEVRPLGYLEMFAFSFWVPGEITKEDLAIALGFMAAYLVGAVLCWITTRALFDRREQSAVE